MFWILGVLWGFLAGGPSVSAVPPELALWTNPAALGLFQGTVMHADLLDRSGWLGVAYGPLAYGISSDRTLRLAAGAAVKGPLRLGVTVETGNQTTAGLGWLYRLRYFSLGGSLEAQQDRAYHAAAGLALRPGTDRITLYADLLASAPDFQTSPDLRWQAGLYLQPVNGIHLAASVNATPDLEDYTLRAGLDVALDHLRLGVGFGTDQHTGVTVAYNRARYPSWVPMRRYLKATLQTPASEDPQIGLFSRKPSFTEYLWALRRARHDPSVGALFLNLENPGALSWSQIEELHREIQGLRRQNKPVAVYLETLTLKGLYLASAADLIVMPPTGIVLLIHLGSEKVYLKHALEKLDIEVQAPHIGRYKSAVEPLIRDRMSEADREQTRAFLEDLGGTVRRAILDHGGLQPHLLDSLLYHGFLGSAEEAARLGLVDTVIPRHRVEQSLREIWHLRRSQSWTAYATEQVYTFRWTPEKPRVAVVTLEGSIVTGKSGTSPWPLIGGKHIGSSSVAAVLRKLRDDPSVKAVVLRVNSPGGSALASDIIWQAVRDLREKKPVVVSMGQVAASGGYYISSGADAILAERNTITGSIGILATKLSLGRLFQRWGITRDTVLLSPHADAWSLWRPMTDEELQALQTYLHQGYQVFLQRVSTGRHLPVARVDSLGQGRVWSGLRADSLGLVDSLGNVVTAIHEAARRAGLKEGEYRLVVYTTQPRALGFLNLLQAQAWQHPWDLWLREPYLYYLGSWSLPLP